MIENIALYLEKEHRWNKLISLKDEINIIFTKDQDKKYYYSKILWLLKSSPFNTEKIYSIIHIKQRDFNKLIKLLNL